MADSFGERVLFGGVGEGKVEVVEGGRVGDGVDGVDHF